MKLKEFNQRRMRILESVMAYRAKNRGSKPEQWLIQLATAELRFNGSRRAVDREKAIEIIQCLESDLKYISNKCC